MTTTVLIDGDTNLRQFIGRQMAFTTYEGQTLVGTVESFEGLRPIIRFDSGKWAYGDCEWLPGKGFELAFADAAR